MALGLKWGPGRSSPRPDAVNLYRPEETIVRLTTRTRILAVPAAIALGASLFAVSLTWQVPTAQAGSGALDSQAKELVRLMNGARAASGKAALNWDPFLASKARDGAIACPDDATKTISGRADDMSTTGQMNHNLRLCDAATYTVSGTSFVSVMQSWGYGSVGEIIGVNGYNDSAYLYTYKSWPTWTYATTGHMMAGWQTSSSHWNIIMGNYDRVGCGGWASSSGRWYDCALARGGPNGVVGPPTGLPFPNLTLPTPAPPPPAPVRPAAKPTPTPTPSVPPIWTDYLAPLTLGQSYGSTASTPAPSPTSVVEALRAPDATAAPSNPAAGALQQTRNEVLPPPDGSPLPGGVGRVAVLVAGSGAGVFCAVLALLGLRRRRRETAL